MSQWHCVVCGEDLGWDRPSGVCSTECLKRGQEIGGEFENAANVPFEAAEPCDMPTYLESHGKDAPLSQ